MLLNHRATALGSSDFTSFGQSLRRGHYGPASICLQCSKWLGHSDMESTVRAIAESAVREKVNEILG
jgi:hypothetical protein